MSPQLFYNNTSYKQHWKQSECGCSHAAEENIYMLFLCSCAGSCLHNYFIITPLISSTGSKVNVDAVMQQNRNIYVVLMYLCNFMSSHLFYNNTSYKQHCKQSECGCSHAAEQKYTCCSYVAVQVHVSTVSSEKYLFLF